MGRQKGKIVQSKKGKGCVIHLSDVVSMFKTSDDRIKFATRGLIASISKDGKVTSGKRLYKIFSALYQSEDKRA